MVKMQEAINVLQSKQDVAWNDGGGARAQSLGKIEHRDLGPYGTAKAGHVAFATEFPEGKAEVATADIVSTSSAGNISVAQITGVEKVTKSPMKPKPTADEKLLIQKNLNIFATKHSYSGEKDAQSAYGFYSMIQREVGSEEMLDALKATELARFMVGSALEWFQSVINKMQKQTCTLKDGLKLFYVRFAINLTHSDKRLQTCTRKPDESVEQYQARLIVLASELDFIDSMHVVPNPVGVTPQQLLAQFKSGCDNAMWRRECRLCKTLEEAVALVKDILAAEYSVIPTLVCYRYNDISSSLSDATIV